MATLFGLQLSRREIEQLTGRLDQVGGITPCTLATGRAAGVRALHVSMGTGFDFDACADRALDLSHAKYLGMSLCWRSQNGDAAPTYYDPNGNQFLRTFFGGLLTTCGLTNFGPGATDQWGTVGVHGRINAAPAEGLRWQETWDGDECAFEISGTMRESSVFGENLSLHRTFRTRLGSNTIWLSDTVRNDGFSEWPHMILYHINGGFPLVAPGTRLYVSHDDVQPRDAEAEIGIDVWNRMSEPTAGFAEQVFLHSPINCGDGRAAVALINDQLRAGEGLGLAIRFDTEQLPAFQEWRMMGEGTYVLGMEPANCRIEGRANAAREGVLPFIGPGESRHYDVEFQILTTRSEIDAMVRLIEAANSAHALEQ